VLARAAMSWSGPVVRGGAGEWSARVVVGALPQHATSSHGLANVCACGDTITALTPQRAGDTSKHRRSAARGGE